MSDPSAIEADHAGPETTRDEADASAPLPTRRRLGIAATIALLLGGLALVLAFEAAAVINRTLGNANDDRLQDLGYAATRDVAEAIAAPLAREDTANLRNLALHLARGVGIAYILVVGPEGELVAHSFEGQPPTELFGANDAPGGQGARHTKLTISDPVARAGRPVLDVAMPVLHGQLGVVRVGMDAGSAHANRRRALGRLFAIMGPTSLLAIALGWLVMRRFETSPTFAPHPASPLFPPEPQGDEPPAADPLEADGPTDERPAPSVHRPTTADEVASPSIAGESTAVEASEVAPAAFETEQAMRAPQGPRRIETPEVSGFTDEIAPPPAPDVDDERATADQETLTSIIDLVTRAEVGEMIDPNVGTTAEETGALAAVRRTISGLQAAIEAERRTTTEERQTLGELQMELSRIAKDTRRMARGRLQRATPDGVATANPDLATLERALDAIARHVGKTVSDVRQYVVDVGDGAERLDGICSALEHDLGVQATDTDLVAAKLANLALGISGVAKDHVAAASEGTDLLQRAQAGSESLVQLGNAMMKRRRALDNLTPRLGGLVHGTELLSGHAEALSNAAAQTHLLVLDAARILTDVEATGGTDLRAVAERLRTLLDDASAAADALTVQAEHLVREAGESAQWSAQHHEALVEEPAVLHAMRDQLQSMAGVATSLTKRVGHAAEATGDMPDVEAMATDVQTIRKAVGRLQDATREGARVVQALRQVTESAQQSLAGFEVEA